MEKKTWRVIGECYICGGEVSFLIQSKATLLRESACSVCGASIRNSDLAKGILDAFGIREWSLKSALSKLAVHKILSIGMAVEFLRYNRIEESYMSGNYFDSAL